MEDGTSYNLPSLRAGGSCNSGYISRAFLIIRHFLNVPVDKLQLVSTLSPDSLEDLFL